MAMNLKLAVDLGWWISNVILPFFVAILGSLVVYFWAEAIAFPFRQLWHLWIVQKAQRQIEDQNYLAALTANMSLLQIEFGRCRSAEILIFSILILTALAPLIFAAGKLVPELNPSATQVPPLTGGIVVLVVLLLTATSALGLFFTRRWRQLLMQARRAHLPAVPLGRWLN
jgi:hypothetical protein